MSKSPQPNILLSGVILAGGAARRMGGEDKGLLTMRGRPLVSYVLECLRPHCHPLWINCQRNHERYAAFGHPLLEDSLPGGLGPLAGLLAAMEQAHTEYVLSVPCDTPFIPQDLVPRMLACLQQEEAELCSVTDGERVHPVIMLAKRSLHTELRDYLLSGERKVHHWFCSHRHCLADFSDQAGAFININTPQQLDAASRENTHG